MKCFNASLLAVLVFSATVAVAGAEPAVDATNSSTLGQVTSFEVESFPHWEFSVDNGRVNPEILEYARRELQQSKLLQTASPGEALLHFYCQGANCRTVRAEVTLGKEGPVIWQTVVKYTKNPFHTYRDSHGLAEKVIQQLSADYQKSLEEVPVKIDIKSAE